jgi:hypothetical protein
MVGNIWSYDHLLAGLRRRIARRWGPRLGHAHPHVDNVLLALRLSPRQCARRCDRRRRAAASYPLGEYPEGPPRESPLGGPPKGGKRPGGSPEGVPPGGIRQRTRCEFRYGCHPKLLAERRITTISWFGCGDRTARGDSPANPHSRVSYRYHRKWLAGRRVSGPEGSLCWTGRAGWTVDGADGVDGAGGAR